MIVQASVAVSVDGYIDDLSDRRLVLSHAADWEEVRSLRAESDAILVGAETIRRDNPALVTRDERLRELRAERGLPADPVKVTLSRNADLDPTSRFFTEGDGENIVFVGRFAPQDRTAALSRVATVIHAGSDCLTADYLIGELGRKGIERLFIEGGSRVLTLFLSENRIDYLRVAVAPFFVGEPSAPRMTIGAKFPFDKDRRMTVLDVKKVGDMTVTDYALGQQATDRTRLLQAIGLSLKCPPSDKAYSVGAVLVTRDGQVFTGYSRETAPDNHAEEEAILKAEQAGATLEGATIYSSMEPCSTRRSKPRSCSALIIDRRMKRVVFAVREPDRFVRCRGEQLLRDAGIEVCVLESLAKQALEANAHILSGQS